MKREKISLELLLLSDGNPRLEPSFGEDEAINNMVADQNNKLVELASDIVVHGLNPLDTVGVYPSETYRGFYEIGEGNRRMCALKLLAAPERIQHINAALFSKFAALSKGYSVPESIEVVVFEDEAAMQHWMEIRHMGEQGGKGLAKWNSVQKARFNRMQTGSDALLDFWDWMDANKILTYDEILDVTKTNWQRILRERYFPFLRLQYDGAYVVQPEDISSFAERIKAIQKRLSGETVAIVYDQLRIENFYNSISNELYGKNYQEVIYEEKPQLSMRQHDCPIDLNQNHIEDLQKSQTSLGLDKGGAGDGKPEDDFPTDECHNRDIGRDVFNGCATIIPFGYAIRTENMRLNKIVNELKKINADTFPNACGTLLRALFELSAKVYLEKQDGSNHTSDEFESAIRQAANGLRQQGRIDNSQHSAICKDIDNLRKIFNGYMHNTEGYPSSEALKNFFKCHRKFIQECLR